MRVLLYSKGVVSSPWDGNGIESNGRLVIARGVNDEAISRKSKDCFAKFILSVVEGLAMTLQ